MPQSDQQRRAAGELEAAVLAALWHAGRALSGGEVQGVLAGQPGASCAELSYSTVVTILTRLHAKKALDRFRDGRSFRYAPVADEAGLAARRLAALLDGQPDRHAVLSRFVADLPQDDERLLRGLLGGGAAGVD